MTAGGTRQSLLGLRSIFADRQNAIWLSVGSGALRHAQGKFTRFGHAEGLPPQWLEMIREDAAGRIVAVTQDGVFRLDGERFVPLAPGRTFSSPRTGAALADRADGLLSAATSDNGIGIPAGNLPRTFHHGFTTRPNGHGYALHSGALAARELGGALSVHSDGPDHGATFTLELPCKPDTPAHEHSVR
jgi:hypothetical protein